MNALEDEDSPTRQLDVLTEEQVKRTGTMGIGRR